MTDLVILEAATAARAEAREYLDAELDALCRRLGLEPWEAWRRDRHLERMDAQAAVNRQLRADLAKIARPVTDAFGWLEGGLELIRQVYDPELLELDDVWPMRYPHEVTMPRITEDATVPPGVVELRDGEDTLAVIAIDTPGVFYRRDERGRFVKVDRTGGV